MRYIKKFCTAMQFEKKNQTHEASDHDCFKKYARTVSTLCILQ